MKVYVAYDSKPPYLPIAVEDSETKLADKVGKHKTTIASAILKSERSGRRSRYARVEIEEDEDEMQT